METLVIGLTLLIETSMSKRRAKGIRLAARWIVAVWRGRSPAIDYRLHPDGAGALRHVLDCGAGYR
jgi:hypothetical protein